MGHLTANREDLKDMDSNSGFDCRKKGFRYPAKLTKITLVVQTFCYVVGSWSEWTLGECSTTCGDSGPGSMPGAA